MGKGEITHLSEVRTYLIIYPQPCGVEWVRRKSKTNSYQEFGKFGFYRETGKVILELF
jgi:hypothetical protein